MKGQEVERRRRRRWDETDLDGQCGWGHRSERVEKEQMGTVGGVFVGGDLTGTTQANVLADGGQLAWTRESAKTRTIRPTRSRGALVWTAQTPFPVELNGGLASSPAHQPSPARLHRC